MTWEHRLLELFDDLEQQAEGLSLVERDADVAGLARAGYAEVDLLSRLHGAVGTSVRLGLRGGAVGGRVVRAGSDWLLLDAERTLVMVPLGSVVWLEGLGERTVPEEARGLGAGLGLVAALRALSEEGASVVLVDPAGLRQAGVLRRVGRDFVELVVLGPLAGPDSRARVLPVGALDRVEVRPTPG